MHSPYDTVATLRYFKIAQLWCVSCSSGLVYNLRHQCDKQKQTPAWTHSTLFIRVCRNGNWGDENPDFTFTNILQIEQSLIFCSLANLQSTDIIL